MHDSSVVLTEESYDAGMIGGVYEDNNKPAFFVELHDIAMLAKMFGLNTSNTIQLSNISNQREGISKNGKMHIDLLKFPIHKKYTYTPDDLSCKILKLECQVVSERMVNIKVTFKETGSAEFSENIEEMTYCGSFTIWWKSEKDKN